MPTKKDIVVEDIKQNEFSVRIVGDTPMIYNAMSEKAKRQLLLPSGRKGAAEKKASLKHDPEQEYRDSVYRRVGDGPTRLVVPSTMFKAALMDAALDTPSTTSKAALGRMTYVVGHRVDIYGVPELLMSVVRSADINKTPDIRTRAILPQWACEITVRYAVPMLTQETILSLLAAAGFLLGIGDFRQQKGKGSHGLFSLVGADPDPRGDEWREIVAGGGREAQDAALADPRCYDAETEDLFFWWREEAPKRRESMKAA